MRDWVARRVTIVDEFAIVFACNDEKLVGILHHYRASAASVAMVIVVGGPQYRVGSHRQFVLLARAVAESGYPVLRFDYRGMGDSEGRPRSFESVSADIRAACDALASRVPSVKRIVLFGLCDGASAALLYLKQQDRRIHGLILANPWARTEMGAARAYVSHYYPKRMLSTSFWRKLLTGSADITGSIRSFVISLRRATIPSDGSDDPANVFLDDMRMSFAGFCGPTLVLISGRDLTAKEFTDAVQGSGEWTRAINRSSVTCRTLANADHTFSTLSEFDDSTREVLNWLRSHYSAPAAVTCA